MPAPAHDFAASYALALQDTFLRNYLKTQFGTDAISQPGKSELVDSTALVMNWVLQQARERYASAPERLVAAISSATGTRKNALAVWSTSGKDWIVISEGLMEHLRDGVDDLGHRFTEAFPELMDSELMRALLAQEPLQGGFTTTLGSYLYFAAVAFLTGHEAGHHIDGHDGYFTGRAHAEDDADSPDAPTEQWMTKQALEREADRIGLSFCRYSMMTLLARLWDIGDFDDERRRSYQRVLAALISVGAMAVTLWLKPRKTDWSELPGRAHPPAVVRALNLSLEVARAIKENFGYLDETSHGWIRLMSMEVVVSATIVRGSEEDRIVQERLARGGEPAAIRATGIRRAIHDPEFLRYSATLDAALRKVQPRLRPRN